MSDSLLLFLHKFNNFLTGKQNYNIIVFCLTRTFYSMYVGVSNILKGSFSLYVSVLCK